MALTQPDFSKIFASGSAIGEILNMPDDSYLRGWGYLNASEPPPMEFFNYIMNGYDLKLYYLFETQHIRKNSTHYEKGDIVRSPNLGPRYYLVCTKTGTTDTAEPKWGEETVVTDGSCEWKITDITNATLLDGKDRGYFETLIDNNAKIKKVTFTASGAAWSNDGTLKKLTITKGEFTCLVAYRTNGELEEQVMTGVSQDSKNFYIHAPAAFDGYLVAIRYTR